MAEHHSAFLLVVSGTGVALGCLLGCSDSAGPAASPSGGAGTPSSGGGTAPETGGQGQGGSQSAGSAGSPPVAGSGGSPLPPVSCLLSDAPPVTPPALPSPTGPSSAAQPGLIDGVTSWLPPTTPNGLVPQQSWYSVGTTPAGDTYFSSADHVTNSALYKIELASDTCFYAGDARAASEAVDNWNAGESAQKFHIRPTFHQGRVYVATTDFSDPNAGYLDHRGFHWYAFDEASATFMDLSVSEPGGVAVGNFQCMAMTLDAPRGALYCLGTPNGNLYRYDIAAGTTEDLGRPAEVAEEFVTVGRFMWADAEGTVYFTYSGYDSVFAYAAGGGLSAKAGWDLGGLELKFGQWSLDRSRIYLGDYEGRLYVFDDLNDTFGLIGQATVPVEYESTEALYLWQTRLFQISADERKYYFMNDSSTGAYAMFEYDIMAQTTTKIAELSELDAGLPGPYLFHSAYDSWDTLGRFTYVNFNMVATDAMRVTRIDPVRVKVAKGLLPELVSVDLASADGTYTVTRTGSSTAELEVNIAVDVEGQARLYQKWLIPAGSAAQDVTHAVMAIATTFPNATFGISVLPDGNDYVLGASPTARVIGACTEL